MTPTGLYEGTPSAGGSAHALISLLLHFDGTDGATTTTDDGPDERTITLAGDAELDTAQKKFGTASLLLDGNGDLAAIALKTGRPVERTPYFGPRRFRIERNNGDPKQPGHRFMELNFLNAFDAELIAQIHDTGHEHRAASPEFLIYNTLPGTTSAAGVQATLNSGRTIEADVALLAIPVPALRQIALDLPASRQAALAGVDYHKIVQLHCVVDSPFWEAPDWGGSWWTDGLLGRVFTRPMPNSERYNMTIWINGDSCDPLNALDDQTCTDTILQALWKLAPSAQEVTSVGQLVRWTKDPLAGGSWARWGPGQAGSAHAAIRAPAGRLFFAGEHTAEAYRGMEAAMESGERAALEIMRALT